MILLFFSDARISKSFAFELNSSATWETLSIAATDTKVHAFRLQLRAGGGSHMITAADTKVHAYRLQLRASILKGQLLEGVGRGVPFGGGNIPCLSFANDYGYMKQSHLYVKGYRISLVGFTVVVCCR